MAGRLLDKVAVVTGAAPRGEGVGNGMATAILFAREGAKVVLVNRSAERADKLAKQIKDEGGEAAVFAGDVAKADAAEAMADFAARKYGRLDILHNDVGGGGLRHPEHPRQLHRRGLGAYAHGGAHGRRGARAAQEHGADENRGHGVGHRSWRGLSRLRRIALGDGPAAADRRWAGGTAAVAALGRRAGGAPL